MEWEACLTLLHMISRGLESNVLSTLWHAPKCEPGLKMVSTIYQPIHVLDQYVIWHHCTLCRVKGCSWQIVCNCPSSKNMLKVQLCNSEQISCTEGLLKVYTCTCPVSVHAQTPKLCDQSTMNVVGDYFSCSLLWVWPLVVVGNHGSPWVIVAPRESNAVCWCTLWGLECLVSQGVSKHLL